MLSKWSISSILDISSVQTGKWNANHARENGRYRFYTCAQEYLQCDSKVFGGECIILPGNGANVGEAYYYNGEFDAYQRTYVIYNIKINSKYLYYHLFLNWKRINTNKQFGSATNYIRIGNFLNYLFPIAPKNEQNRIVEKIEELFSDLDKATEDLKKSQEQLRIYRQAVLKAAFEGKLVHLNSSEYLTFSDVCEINPSKREIIELNDDLEVTFLPMPTVSERGVIIEKKIKKLKEVKRGYTFFKNNDVLLAKITPCFENGKRAIVQNLKNNIGFGSTEFHVLRAKDEVLPKWIYYGISSEDFRNKAKMQMTGTAGQKRVPKRALETFKIPVPIIKVQELIIKEIESRLSVCDKLEDSIQQSLEKIVYLRQSILKKAFGGKLVPQDPEDEPAEKLLERIKLEKEKFESNNKKRKKR